MASSTASEVQERVVTALLAYFRANGRTFPWRTKGIEPYRQLVTEILLRRTTASKVASLWHDFFTCYSTIGELAAVNTEFIAELLLPLGLHEQRAAQLSEMANHLMETTGGEMPRTFEDTISLAGVGEYTANAYLLLAFDLPTSPVDVNVERLVCRLHGWSKLQKPSILQTVLSLKHDDRKDVFLGMLDLAADMCRPQSPRCSECPLTEYCIYASQALRVEVSRSHSPGSAAVVVLTDSELRQLQRQQCITLRVTASGPPKFKCLLYVQTPVTAVVGTGNCKLTKGLLHVDLDVGFTPQIQLVQLTNRLWGMRLFRPLCWVQPGRKFRSQLKRLQKTWS